MQRPDVIAPPVTIPRYVLVHRARNDTFEIVDTDDNTVVYTSDSGHDAADELLVRNFTEALG